MSFKIKVLIFSLLFVGLLLEAGFALGQKVEITYPNLPAFFNAYPPQVVAEKIKSGEIEKNDAFPLYIKYFYGLILMVCGLITVGAITYGGLKYLISSGAPARMAEAKEWISGGILGLIILLSSYIILTLLNPDLSIFRLSVIPIEKCDCEAASLSPYCQIYCKNIPTPTPQPLVKHVEIPLGWLVERVKTRSEIVKIQAGFIDYLNSTNAATSSYYHVSLKGFARCLETLSNQCTCSVVPTENCQEVNSACQGMCLKDPCDKPISINFCSGFGIPDLCTGNLRKAMGIAEEDMIKKANQINFELAKLNAMKGALADEIKKLGLAEVLMRDSYNLPIHYYDFTAPQKEVEELEIWENPGPTFTLEKKSNFFNAFAQKNNENSLKSGEGNKNNSFFRILGDVWDKIISPTLNFSFNETVSAQTSSTSGVNIDPTSPSGGYATPEQIKSSGADWVRLVYKSEWGLNYYSSYIEELHNAGIKVLLVLNQETLWPAAGVNDAFINDFAATAGEIAKNLGNNVDAYEIWNEEDAQSAASLYIPPEVYANLLKFSFTAIKNESSADVVIGGLITGDTAYLNNVITLAKDFFDQVGLHPYLTDPQAILNKIIEYASLTSKPVWITEFGWPTSNQQDQASFVSAVCQLLSGNVGKIMWYAWSDGMNPNFGLIDSGGNAKPSYFAFQEFCANITPGTPPEVPAGVPGCFHLSADAVYSGGYVNVTVCFNSDGLDGDVKLETNGALTGGWNSWNKNTMGPFCYGPQYTGSPFSVPPGTTTVTYTGTVSKCAGSPASLTCIFNVDLDGNFSSNCGGTTLNPVNYCDVRGKWATGPSFPGLPPKITDDPTNFYVLQEGNEELISIIRGLGAGGTPIIGPPPSNPDPDYYRPPPDQTVPPNMDDFIEYARFASQKTGVRVSLILTIIYHESGYGQFVGSGRFPDDVCAATVTEGYPPYTGTTYCDVIDPVYINCGSFIKVWDEIGYIYPQYTRETVPVSRAGPYTIGGKTLGHCGGAMGPAQAMSYTWFDFKNKVKEITGSNPPSPWEYQDAFVFAALHLKERGGASSQTCLDEATAAWRYVGGHEEYGEQVVKEANKIAEEIGENYCF